MADDNDAEAVEMIDHLMGFLAMLGTACASLPLPIMFPTGVLTLEVCTSAVADAYDRTVDLPIPDDQKAQLGMALLHWLTAMDLIGLAVHDAGGYNHRFEAALLNILAGKVACTDLMDWITAENAKE